MLPARRFHFQPVLTVFTLAGLAILMSLGTWQLKRLDWKRGLIEKTQTQIGAAPIAFEEALARAEAGEDMEYTPVRITGFLRPSLEQKVFGAYEANAGAYIFTPLRLAPGRVVYINRGFVPQEAAVWDCRCDPDNPTPVTIAGLFRSAERPVPPASWFLPQTQSADGLWYVRDPVKFAAGAELETPPYYIDSFEVSGVEWPRGGTTRLNFNNRHLEYALTWFGLAAALLAVWLAFSLPKRE